MHFARWTSLLAAILIVAVGLVWGASPAAACSCAGPPFEAQEGHEGVAAYDAVFIGTAVSLEEVSSDEVEWVFDVASVLHGDVASPITLSAPIDGAGCGLDWVSVGSTIAVGVRAGDGELRTGLCSVDSEAAVDGVGERRPALEPGDPQAINADDEADSADVELLGDEAQGDDVEIVDEEPTESAASQIILIAIGIFSILGAAVLVAVLARRSD